MFKISRLYNFPTWKILPTDSIPQTILECSFTLLDDKEFAVSRDNNVFKIAQFFERDRFIDQRPISIGAIVDPDWRNHLRVILFDHILAIIQLCMVSWANRDEIPRNLDHSHDNSEFQIKICVIINSGNPCETHTSLGEKTKKNKPKAWCADLTFLKICRETDLIGYPLC